MSRSCCALLLLQLSCWYFSYYGIAFHKKYVMLPFRRSVYGHLYIIILSSWEIAWNRCIETWCCCIFLVRCRFVQMFYSNVFFQMFYPNVFLQMFCQNILSKCFIQISFSNVYQNIGPKWFIQMFYPNNVSKCFIKEIRCCYLSICFLSGAARRESSASGQMSRSSRSRAGSGEDVNFL